MTMYTKKSPYFTTSIVNNYLDIINFRDIPKENDDVLFELTATYELRPDLLAYDLYGDHQLWWVFAIRNRSIIKDPVFDMVAGIKIFLPKATTLKQVVG
mgnify:CR=1 FL=1|jgi:hypothetical protein